MIAVLIPSRGRQALLAQTVRGLLDTATLPSTRIIIGLDEDEPILDSTYDLILDSRVLITVRPREDTLGEKYNRCAGHLHNEIPNYNNAAELTARNADAYLLWADDMTIVTVGWDQRITDKLTLFRDGLGMVFFGKVPGVMQPGIVVSARLSWDMGQLCDPLYAYWWQDTRLIEIGRMCGRILNADIDVKLLGELKGASRGVRDVSWWGQFFDATRDERKAIAERIIDAGSDAPYRKEQLRALLPSWDKIFQQANSRCSDPAQAAEVEKHFAFDAPADERYLRVKARAQEAWANWPQLVNDIKARAVAA